MIEQRLSYVMAELLLFHIPVGGTEMKSGVCLNVVSEDMPITGSLLGIVFYRISNTIITGSAIPFAAA